MITARDVQPLVASPEFQRALRLAARDQDSRPYRALKSLERFARGTTRQAERDEQRGYGTTTHEASGG